jgi:hypothetical protein
MQGVFLLSLGLLLIFGACRRNQPTLIDRNEAPNTELWFAPPDSTEYEYLVHLYWRGVDNDGTAVQFIWTIRDSIVEDENSDLYWDPSNKLSDFREGRTTTRTDSIFSFTAFKDVDGLGVNTNRQAFLIAAIDDNGTIDASPAWTEFIAKIDAFPEIHFWTHIDLTKTEYVHADIPKDTIGVMQPLAISFNGTTANGAINAYKFFSLTSGVFIDGENLWSENLTDTMVTLPNTGNDMLPSGVFKLAVQCRDDADAESPVDSAPPNKRGTCQVVVNFDPQTEFLDVYNTYHTTGGMVEEEVFFADGVPDTVPYKSFVRIRYFGEDDERDGKINCTSLKPDSCIGFQVAYRASNPYNSAANEFSLWHPRNGLHDTDSLSSTDSNTFYIGTLNYILMARAVDEHSRPDGTPPSIKIVGNFAPSLDSIAVIDHLGQRIDLSIVDTLTWNFWKGEGFPYNCECDTVDKPTQWCRGNPSDPFECQFEEWPNNGESFDFFKVFSFSIRAWGHDHPKDPPPSATDGFGSGIKSWNYRVMNTQLQVVDLGKSVLGWFEQKNASNNLVLNRLNDEIRWKVFYPGPFAPEPDPVGDTVFENLPSWLGQEYTFILKARDTPVRTPDDFTQWIMVNGRENLINSFGDASLGRQTPERFFAFHIELVR